MRKTTAIFLFCLIFLVACASPVPQPTTTPTVRPTLTATATQTPTPTETTIPTPTKTATPEVVAAIEIANMGEFDPAWYTDVGKVVAVKDLGGAGEALITILDVKNLPEGQQLSIPKLRSNGKSNLDPYTIWNVGIKSIRLIDINLKNNLMPNGQPIDDGQWCQIEGVVDVRGDGNLTTFSIINKGHFGNGNDPVSCFNNLNPGDKVSMTLGFSEVALSFQEAQDGLNIGNAPSAELVPKIRLSLVGYGSTAMTWDSVLKAIKEGENLGIDKANVLILSKK